jgi:hypothetical protein
MSQVDQLSRHTAAMASEVENNLKTYPVQLALEGATAKAGGPARAYPAEFTVRDPREERLTVLKNVAEQWKDSGFTATLPGELVDYFIEKKRHIEFANWEKWVQSNFNLTDPTQVQLLKKLAPWYFERRLEYLKKILGLMYAIHKIDLLGPEDEKELFILYEIQNGEITVPKLDWGTSNVESENIQKGMFSLRNWIGSKPDAHRPKGLGAFGAYGPKGDKTNSIARLPTSWQNLSKNLGDSFTNYSNAFLTPVANTNERLQNNVNLLGS